jgi:hypothetical protein
LGEFSSFGKLLIFGKFFLNQKQTFFDGQHYVLTLTKKISCATLRALFSPTRLVAPTPIATVPADSSPWLRADFAVELMRHVSVGPGGIFAVKAKDDSVWYRTYEQVILQIFLGENILKRIEYT